MCGICSSRHFNGKVKTILLTRSYWNRSTRGWFVTFTTFTRRNIPSTKPNERDTNSFLNDLWHISFAYVSSKQYRIESCCIWTKTKSDSFGLRGFVELDVRFVEIRRKVHMSCVCVCVCAPASSGVEWTQFNLCELNRKSFLAFRWRIK